MIMLPVPFIKFVPSVMADNPDDALTAMTDKADTHIEEWRDEILELAFMKIPERVLGRYLPDLGDYLATKFFTWDTETAKRKKIQIAIQTHKQRSTWVYDAKPKIDLITGLDAQLYKPDVADQDDCILLAQEATDPVTYWLTLNGADGTDDKLGWWLIGDWTEYVIAGNICIDCHFGINVPTLTAGEIALIVITLEEDIFPAYYRGYLGYVDATGLFIYYAGGTVN